VGGGLGKLGSRKRERARKGGERLDVNCGAWMFSGGAFQGAATSKPPLRSVGDLEIAAPCASGKRGRQNKNAPRLANAGRFMINEWPVA
jgi:hypothetical protein